MRKYKDLILFLSVTSGYVLIALLSPTDPAILAKHDITQLRAHLISVTIVVPFALIWLSAFYAFNVFRSYSRVVRKSNEGPGLTDIAKGLKFLAFSLPVSALIAVSVGYVAIKQPNQVPSLTVLRNYINLTFILTAFIYISNGARMLASTVKHRTSPVDDPRFWPLGMIILSCVFVWLIIARPIDGSTTDVVYGMPNWLIIMTLAIPYLYAWFRGLLAAHYMYFYLANVRGQIYKKSLSYLSRGIIVVIIVNVSIQFLVTISPRINRLDITPILSIIYVLVAFYALGFGLITYGARKLKRIEDA